MSKQYPPCMHTSSHELTHAHMVASPTKTFSNLRLFTLKHAWVNLFPKWVYLTVVCVHMNVHPKHLLKGRFYRQNMGHTIETEWQKSITYIEFAIYTGIIFVFCWAINWSWYSYHLILQQYSQYLIVGIYFTTTVLHTQTYHIKEFYLHLLVYM